MALALFRLSTSTNAPMPATAAGRAGGGAAGGAAAAAAAVLAWRRSSRRSLSASITRIHVFSANGAEKPSGRRRRSRS